MRLLLSLQTGLIVFAGGRTEANGLVHLATSGETSWYDFARVIVDGLRERGVPITVNDVQPILTDGYPTRAKRPHNSRIDVTRLKNVFGIELPHWKAALVPET